MEEISIEPMKREEIPAVGQLVGRVMATTPIHAAVFGGNAEEVLLRQEEMFLLTFQHHPGQTFVTKRAGQIIGAYRMIKWPACQVTPDEARRVGPLMKKVLKDSLDRVREWVSVWSAEDPPASHWHLGPIAVEARSQRQGIGSRMLEHFCRKVDQNREAAYLETDLAGNVRLYRRFGFNITREVDLFGVTNYFMWRAPDRSGQA